MSPILRRSQALENLLRRILKWASFAGTGAGIYFVSSAGRNIKSIEIKDLDFGGGEEEYLIKELRSNGSWTLEKRYIGLNFKITCDGTGKSDGWENDCKRIIETTKTTEPNKGKPHYIDLTTTKPTTKHEKGKHYKIYRNDGTVIESGHKEYYIECGTHNDICKYPPSGWKFEEMTFS